MLLSQKCQYAISGVLRLAALPRDGYCRIVDLLQDTDAPRHAVAKVFQELVRHRILMSVRGTHGGFRLADNAMARPLMDIYEAVEGPFRSEIVVDRSLCLCDQACPLIDLIRPIAAQLEQMLRTTRIQDIVDRYPVRQQPCCQGNSSIPGNISSHESTDPQAGD